VFEANPDFPAALGGPPGVRRLVIAVVDEATTKLAGLVAGELHVAGIAPLHASLVRRIRGREVVDYPLLFTYGLIWNTSRPPFDDLRLRRALTMAIDRGQILEAYVYGFGEAAHGPVPSAHPDAVAVDSIPFDREGAGRLLDSIGWRRVDSGDRRGDGGERSGERGVRMRDGAPLRFTLTTVGSADNVLEQLIQADLAAVGVEVRIRQLELGSFLSMAEGAGRDYDALVMGIPGDLDLGYLAGLFDSRRRSGALQYAQYSNPAVDRALDRGDLAQVQRLVARDVPITFLYHARGVQGVNTRLTGLRMDLRGELASLTGWRMEEGGGR
jgi:peptide/nickel transport system substrate-binding protein